MKCQSVACLWWGGAPPSHRVTAAAVLNRPLTLFTGGSDGSIIWWNLSNHKEIWPMAMLCGHAAAIVDLEICSPIIGCGERENSCNVDANSPSSGALISACTDGVLCIWSRQSGHCTRRRKLPPWVGIPSRLSTLPMSQRYVCISCICVDAATSFAHHATEAGEGSNTRSSQMESMFDQEAHNRRASKCAIIIVDSCTLNIIQTVFHGTLSMGPLNFLDVVPSLEDMEKQSVILADIFGKVQSIAMPESDSCGDGGSRLQKSSSHVSLSVGIYSSHDRVMAVSVATRGNILVLIFRNICVFKLATNGTVIGEISLVDSPLCNEETFLCGGMFLPNGGVCNASDDPDHTDMYLENVIVWNNEGAALIYMISSSSESFYFEPQCELPPVSFNHDMNISIKFCVLNDLLLRVESTCFDLEDSTLWEPHVSIFQPLPLQSDRHRAKKRSAFDDSFMCDIIGEGGFQGYWVGGFRSISEAEAEALSHQKLVEANKVESGECFKRGFGKRLSNFIGLGADSGHGLPSKRKTVSSSLVLSDDFYAPYAVIYGFSNGEIEIVRFEMFSERLSTVDSGEHPEVSPCTSEQRFSGHTGAVLCLAAHHVRAVSSFKRVLVSGSADCTVRIWDLDSGNVVSVMHHHVGSVRQIILPPFWTDRPWADCFLSVGEDSSVALISLDTVRVERMFTGHPGYPGMVAWDSARGYLACLCQNLSASPDAISILYLWDIKTGARERVIRGTASYSMFDHFCRGIHVNYITENILGGTTSASSLLLSVTDDSSLSKSHVMILDKGFATVNRAQRRTKNNHDSDSPQTLANEGKLPIPKDAYGCNSYADGKFGKQAPAQIVRHKKSIIKCSCPFPGIATLKFDLSSLMNPLQMHEELNLNGGVQEHTLASKKEFDKAHVHQTDSNGDSVGQVTSFRLAEERAWVKSLEGCLLRFSLSFLHSWDIDHELDKLLIDEMSVCRPTGFIVASGLLGDRGSMTLAFPGSQATLELWRSSSEFCAMQSLTMVSLAQRVISLSHSSSTASSALATFYTRHFAEKVMDTKPPLLQLLVSFWQDPSEHVRMAARSLFHCAASRAIPMSLCGRKIVQHANYMSSITDSGSFEHSNTTDSSASSSLELDEATEPKGDDESSVLSWLESFEMQDWISCIGGTSQDAMASHIIVAAALAIWYPSLVKPNLPKLVVHPLMKLVMVMSDKYSSTAAELLAEGMESTWKACINSEIPRLIGDIFFQIECLNAPTANDDVLNPSLSVSIRDTLVGILLPSLAMADIVGFFNVIESQIWATASDSPVHLVSIMTLIRVVRGSPKPLALHLDKAVNFILQTMDHGNPIMRKACLPSSMTALKEIARVFPMVDLHEVLMRLAVGDVIGHIHAATIQVYDLRSVTKIKVLDASGPPGFPSILGGVSETTITTAISALSFSPDGEGLVAFSKHGLMIRWWSLGSGWWEKLSRSLVPVQCTKLIFVPPWEGSSPKSTRSSVIASIVEQDSQVHSQEKISTSSDMHSPRVLIRHLDLSFHLEWVGNRKVVLTQHGQELSSFLL